jgi:hypothetical protein
MNLKPPLSRPMIVIVFLIVGPIVLFAQGRRALRVEWREARRQWRGEWT